MSFFAHLGLGGQVFGAVTGAFGSFYAAKSKKANLEFQADMADINARILEQGAQSALLQGQHETMRVTMRAGQVKANQRAAMAANGVDIGVGSAAEVVASTDIMKEIDANTIKANAVRSAFGYRSQAVGVKNEAIMGRAQAKNISPFASGMSSLLSSAGNVADAWKNATQPEDPSKAANDSGGGSWWNSWG